MSEPMTFSLEAQTEYIRARQNGYDFTNHGFWCHYLFPRNMMEPTVLSEQPDRGAAFYLWSLHGRTLSGAQIGFSTSEREPIITPTNDALGWTSLARKVAAAAERK